MASLDVGQLQTGQKRSRSVRSQSCGNVMRYYTVPRRSNETVNEFRPITISKIFTPQRNERVVTVQIENVRRKKRIQRYNESPKGILKLKNSRHRKVSKIARSTSLNENAFVTPTTELSSKCSREESEKIQVFANIINQLEHIGQQTVTELTSEKEPAWNSYEETKL